MKRAYNIFCVLIFVFLYSCEETDTTNISIQINLISDQDFNYRYDDFNINYLIQGTSDERFALQCKLLDVSDNEIFVSGYDDTIFVSSIVDDTLNLRKVDWYIEDDQISFYDIECAQYRLQLFLINYLSNHTIQKSNKVEIEVNKINPDTSILDNLILYDINGEKYELVEQLEDYDFIIMFDFAYWCEWSRMSVPSVQKIDSICDNLTVLGIEGSNSEYLENFNIRGFIQEFQITYPVFYRIDNLVLNDILHPDNYLSFPRFLLINKNRKVIYRQNGYSEFLVDSVTNHVYEN